MLVLVIAARNQIFASLGVIPSAIEREPGFNRIVVIFYLKIY
jgi:hypothetical protein